jgi:hypothetical protein
VCAFPAYRLLIFRSARIVKILAYSNCLIQRKYVENTRNRTCFFLAGLAFSLNACHLYPRKANLFSQTARAKAWRHQQIENAVFHSKTLQKGPACGPVLTSEIKRLPSGSFFIFPFEPQNHREQETAARNFFGSGCLQALPVLPDLISEIFYSLVITWLRML